MGQERRQNLGGFPDVTVIICLTDIAEPDVPLI
jgi:hypothetical protein